MEGLDTRVETGISLELDKEDFLILALNLLSIVNFRLRFEVLMGPLLLLNFSLELTKEFPLKSEGSSLWFDRPLRRAAADFSVLKFLVNERPWRGHFQFFLGLIFVSWVLLQMEK